MPETAEAWENVAEVVSQGRYGSFITCISDIVRKDGDTFILTEIKSSSSAKTEHALDLLSENRTRGCGVSYSEM